jgi:signal transduction histidine kinase
MKRPLEANVVLIFRWFVALEMIALSMIPIAEYYLFGQFTFVDDPFFALLYQSTLLFVYLSFPAFQYKLKHFFLPIAILIAVIFPSLINLSFVVENLAAGLPINMMHVWALLPLLLIPLVPMAWQYDFKAALVLFGGFGLAEVLIVLYTQQWNFVSVLDFIYATFIRVLSLLLVGFMIDRLMEEQRTQRDQLRLANLKLTRQALVMEEMATMQERNRIARELHDTLAHTMSGLAVQLEAMKIVNGGNNQEIGGMLDTALATTRSGLNETRNILKNLRAGALQELGLEQALQQMISQLQAARSKPSINLFISRNLPLISKELEHIIYRIVQEALKNALQHADAEQVRVELTAKSKTIAVVIEDDGKGFDVHNRKQREGYGLSGMRERAEEIGGTLTIESELGGGTKVRFEVVL